MKRTLTIGVATAALLLAGAGVALAQDAPVLTVDPTAACGRVTLTAEVHEDFNPNGFDTYELAVFAGPNAGNAASDPLGQFVVTAEKPVTKTFTLAEDAYDGDAFVSWSTISGPNPEFYVRGVIAVATDCAPPATTTIPPTSSTTPPAADEFDCADFATRAAAQAKLDETPGADPHRLDADGDRVACELELPAGTDVAPASTTSVVPVVVVPGYSQVSTVPSGGIATGA